MDLQKPLDGVRSNLYRHNSRLFEAQVGIDELRIFCYYGPKPILM